MNMKKQERKGLSMKKFTFLLAASLLLMFLAACGSTDSDKEEKDTGNGDDGKVTIEHELGKTEVDKNPEKVVVFDNGIMDTLDELDIDIAGVPQANLPSYLAKFESDDYANVGAPKEPDLEKIAEVDPDVIIISGRQSDMYDELEEIAPTIYLGVDTDRYMDSFEENMHTIGELFDKEDEIDKELADIEESVDAVKEKAEGLDKKALIIMAADKKISAFGPSSRFGLIHDVFGIPPVDEGIENSTHGQNVSFEYVKEQDPDLLYVVDKGAIKKGSEQPPAKDIIENELVKDSTAYQNDDIYYLNPEVWYQSGGGLVSVKEMIKEVSDSLD